MAQRNSIPSPHGGRLVNRIADRALDPSMLSVKVSWDLRNDIENIADGIFSPLEGFLVREDFESVVRTGRMNNGIPWTVPIVLDIDDETASKIKDYGEVAL